MFRCRFMAVMSVVLCSWMSAGVAVAGGCPCSKRAATWGTSFIGQYGYAEVNPYAWTPHPMQQYPMHPQPVHGFSAGMPAHPPVAGGLTPIPMQDRPAYGPFAAPRSNPLPPPGTIGKTFSLPSRPVPVEQHPRVGMIDVRVEGAEDVIVHDLNAMRTEETISGFRDAFDHSVWHFESKPLYPGLDHIYRVQATFKDADGTETKQERYVRLIMGRVVELTY